MAGRVSRLVTAAVAAVAAAGAAGTVGLAGVGSAATSPGSDANAEAQHYGSSRLHPVGTPPPRGFQQARRVTLNRQSFLHAKEADTRAQATTVASPPSVSPYTVGAADPAVSGFTGLNEVAQASASHAPLEPPDQAICASNTQVLEAVNLAATVHAPDGTPLTAVTSLNDLYGLAPAYDPSTGLYGPFLSDPRCLYDGGRWYVSVLEIDVDPHSGNLGSHSAVLLAVSATHDALGDYELFSIDTTDDGSRGTPAHDHCPCLGDQPLLGADAHGIYLSTNEFPLANTPDFNGAQLYALGKTGLDNGTGARGRHYDLLTHDQNLDYSLQPATVPAGAAYATASSGTEYLVGSTDFHNTGSSSLLVYAISNTASLNTTAPATRLTSTEVATERYAPPAPAVQKAGPHPQGAALGEPEEKIDAGDDRQQQVVLAGGVLWTSLTTRVSQAGTAHDGAAWFRLRPSLSASGVSATVVEQGYVSPRGADLYYPSIGVTADGVHAVMAASMSGPGYYPSVVEIRHGGGLHLVAAGAGPDDGFTGYPEYGGEGVGRWGDYSAAATAPNGTIWAAAENTSSQRDQYANWGTFDFHLRP